MKTVLIYPRFDPYSSLPLGLSYIAANMRRESLECELLDGTFSSFEKTVEKFKNIHRINAAKDQDTARAFGVIGTPTTVIIENGVIKDYFVGITGIPKLLRSLNLH